MDKAIYDKLRRLDYGGIIRACEAELAIDIGDPDVQFLLGLCVRDGRGVPKNEEMFERALPMCAEHGSLLAIGYQLGMARGLAQAAGEDPSANASSEGKRLQGRPLSGEKETGKEPEAQPAGEGELLLFLTPLPWKTSDRQAEGMAGSAAGDSGSSAGNTGRSAGMAGSAAGDSGSSAGNKGRSAGMAGSAAGDSGSSAGNTGRSAGMAGSAAGNSGSSAGNSGSSAGMAGSSAGSTGGGSAAASPKRKYGTAAGASGAAGGDPGSGKSTGSSAGKQAKDEKEAASDWKPEASRTNASPVRAKYSQDPWGGKKTSAAYGDLHRMLIRNDEAGLTNCLKSWEFANMIPRMTESERRDALGEILAAMSQYRSAGKKYMVDICRQMAIKLIETRISVRELKLSMKNEDGQRKDYPVLWYAVWENDYVLADALLRRGVDPNIVSTSHMPDGGTKERSALGTAILRGSLEMTTTLLKYGADLRTFEKNERRDGSRYLSSMLACAVMADSEAIARILLDRGIDVHVGIRNRDREGEWHMVSALFLAVQQTKNEGIARLLLERGANPRTAGPLERLPRDMVRLLKQYEAGF